MALQNRKIFIDLIDQENGEVIETSKPYSTNYFISVKDPSDYIFEINEYDSYKMTVSGKNDEVKVYIQNSMSMGYDDREIEIIDSFVIEPQTFVPGPAYIVIDDGQERYVRYFNVKGTNGIIDNEGLSKIRSVIEEISPGTSLEFKSKIENIVIGDYLNNSNKLKLAALVSRSKKISLYANQIINQPIELLNKGLKVSSDIKKQNSKSINRNLKSPKDNSFYNVVTKRTIDIAENVSLLGILLSVKKYCSTLTNIVQLDILDCEASLEIARNNSKKNIKYYNQIIVDCENREQTLKSLLEELFTISNSCSQVITELDLFALKTNSKTITQRFLKNPAYRYLFNLNNLLSSQNISFILNGIDDIESVNFKSSPVLFELYTYSLVKHMILSEGYKKIQSTEDGSTFISTFEKDGKRIDVRYNVDSLKLYDVTIENEGLISMKWNEKVFQGNHTTPDISIVTLDSDNKPLYASIIEVKCRKFDKLYNDADVSKQLFDYYNFRYKQSNEKILSNFSISNVFCVYPFQSKEEQFKDDNLLDIYYVGLNVDKNFSSSKSYKFIYEKLKDHF